MCGIAGSFGKADVKTLRQMLARLAHRGPDDEHFVSEESFCLGARRLSIIDVKGGRQPISNETGTVWAGQNGELYNFPELRRQLLARGHELRTRCDTEIIPHLYEDHGPSFVEKIDGMFAIALWDSKDKIGVLARDRIGKKPLYYYCNAGVLYFASEIKALLELPDFVRRINLEALHHFLSYKHVPHPLSIFEGVAVLPPAHTLIFRNGEEPRVYRYWDVSFSVNDEVMKLTEEEVAERLLVLLRQGVKRRLISDVPIGFFLSGGVDSGLSTALAAELSEAPIKTFSLVYDPGSTTEGKEEDRRWARWVSRKYGTEHYEESLTSADFPNCIRKIITCFDEPFSGVVSTFFLAQLISRHVRVALSGDGADELFGSYLSHRLAFPLANYDEFRRSGDARLIQPFEDQVDFLASLASPQDWEWRSRLFVFNEEEKAALYNPDIRAQVRGFHTGVHLRQQFAELSANDPLNRVLEGEFRTIFPDQVMTFVDRLSMAHSLEVRTAYLDTRFVEFIASLPGRLKINGRETKYILKKAALNYLPVEMVFRKKEGFLMPINDWILCQLEDYVRRTLSPERLAKHGLFNNAYVQSLVEEIYRGAVGQGAVNKVLCLIVFQEWYELYMN